MSTWKYPPRKREKRMIWLPVIMLTCLWWIFLASVFIVIS